jgi:chromosome segregation ATPase
MVPARTLGDDKPVKAPDVGVAIQLGKRKAKEEREAASKVKEASVRPSGKKFAKRAGFHKHRPNTMTLDLTDGVQAEVKYNQKAQELKSQLAISRLETEHANSLAQNLQKEKAEGTKRIASLTAELDACKLDLAQAQSQRGSAAGELRILRALFEKAQGITLEPSPSKSKPVSTSRSQSGRGREAASDDEKDFSSP